MEKPKPIKWVFRDLQYRTKDKQELQPNLFHIRLKGSEGQLKFPFFSTPDLQFSRS